MAKRLGVNVKSVKRALPQLANAGYIKISKVGRCNVYEIILVDKIGDIMSPIDPPKGGIFDADRGHFRPGIGDTSGPLTLKDNSEENSKSICSTADLDLEFEKWFSVYPRRAGKPEARKEYHRVILAKLATFEQLTFGAENYAAERSGQDGRYTTKPAKWLSDEGWLDEPVVRKEHLGDVADRQRKAGFEFGPRPRGLHGHDAVLAAASRRAGGFAAIAARLRARDPEQSIAEGAQQPTPPPPPPPAPRPAPRPPPPKAPPRQDARRRQYEMEIRAAVGPDVFDDLPEAVIAGLCARWRYGKVPAAELDALRLQHIQARAQGPPSKKASSA